MTADRFAGHILGVGSTSGIRVVVGRWAQSPLGDFADVMLADPAGRRWLLAPSEEVAAYVSATYSFDEVVVTPVVVDGWSVSAGPLRLTASIGRRTPLGWLLRLVPPRLASAPVFTRLTDPIARVLLRGVRTRGTAGGGRREFYGATDLHRAAGITGTWQEQPLGDLADGGPSRASASAVRPRRRA